MSALTDYFTSLANKIRSKTGGSATMTPTQMVGAVDDVYSAGQSNPPTQTKSCTPTTSAQTITPDTGKFLSSVSVDAIQTQTKSTTAGTSASTVSADSGKYMTSVTVNPTPSQEKTANAYQSYSSVLTVTPDSGKYLSKVNIPKAFGGDASTLASSSMETATASSNGSVGFLASNLSKGLYIAILPRFSNTFNLNSKTNVKTVSSLTTGTVTNRDGIVAYIGVIVLESLGNGSFIITSSVGSSKPSNTVYWFLIKLSD